MNRFRNLFLLLVVYCSYATCQNDQSCFGEGNPITPKWFSILSVAKGADVFSTKLFTRIAGQYPDHNIIISPYSLWGVLRLAAYGANGKTRQEVVDALGFMDIGDAYYIGGALQQSLRNLSGIEFYELNQAIFDNSWKVRDCILNKVVDLKRTDFRNSHAAAKLINTDVSVATRGKIDKFVSPDEIVNVDFILINSVYFKGKWLTSFNERFTDTRSFFDATGQLANGQIDMMRMSSPVKLKYLETSTEQIVQLPYDDGTGHASTVSMWILLPHRNYTVSQLLQRLTSDRLDEIDALSSKNPEMVEVMLPKFNASLTIAREVREAFEAQNIFSMFSRQHGDLTNFVESKNSGLYVQDAIHQAVIEVNELGTVASAASALIVTKSWVYNIVMSVNRPFIYIIRDSSLGLSLFTGVMRKGKEPPKEKKTGN